jgi:peptidoglycan/LPS O-acetylase OafA/YrhL
LALFPAMIVVAARAPVTGWRQPLCERAGALSYPVYVLHIPIYGVMTILVRKYGILAENPRPWLGLIAMTTVLAVSWVALKFYDEPVRAWLARLAPKDRATSPQ